MNRHILWMEARYLSPNTINARRVALRSLSAFLGGPILYATQAELQGWLEHAHKAVGQSTLRGYLSNVREFYAWALADQLIDSDPTTRLRGPAAPRYLPRPLDDEAFGRALDVDEVDVLAIIALAGWAGLRAVEIARLDWQDIDLRRRSMRLKGKGRKARVMSIAEELAAVLELLPTRRGPVIRRRDGGEHHVQPWRISHLANEHLHAKGITDTLHALRHRFATRLLEESDGDLRLVQDALGHESPATTSIYTKVRPGKMRDAIQRAARLALDEEPA